MSKLIVNEGNRYKVDPLFQWDSNQTLYIYGLSIADPEIHFANDTMANSLVVQSSIDSDGVISALIPNSLLQKATPVNVYICGYEGETFKTYCKISIPVKARTRPGDYTLELTDAEVYSFNNLTKRITTLESLVNVDENTTLYSYTYNDVSGSLVESSNNVTIKRYLPLISTSLKAIKSFGDKLKTLYSSVKTTSEQAVAIAKGKNQAKVFSTVADMEEWLSNINNANLCSIGDNLYIVDKEVPDYWISEVLTSVDETTGYYYKIAELEVQKVDLQSYVLWTNSDSTIEFDAQTISLDLTEFKRVWILFKEETNQEYYFEFSFAKKNITYTMHQTIGINVDNPFISSRDILISDTGITISASSTRNGTDNSYNIPVEIVGYKY